MKKNERARTGPRGTGGAERPRAWKGRTALPFAALVATLTSSLGAPPLHAQQEVEERRSVASDATIRVNAISHTIQVETWDQSEAWIRGTIDPETERLEVSGGEQALQIQVVHERSSTRGRSSAGELRIQVPRNARLEIHTVSGPIRVTDARGTVDVGSVSGNVQVSGSARSASVNSVSGSVTLESAATDIRANSVSGQLRIVGGGGRIDAHTVSGSLTVEAREPVSFASLRSVSAAVTFDGPLTADASVSAESHSGAVELRLPEGIGATIRVNTMSGSIRNELSGDEPERPRFGPGSSLRATIGDGTAQIDVQSFSGSVRLLRR